MKEQFPVIVRIWPARAHVDFPWKARYPDQSGIRRFFIAEVLEEEVVGADVGDVGVLLRVVSQPLVESGVEQPRQRHSVEGFDQLADEWVKEVLERVGELRVGLDGCGPRMLERTRQLCRMKVAGHGLVSERYWFCPSRTRPPRIPIELSP